MVDFVCRKNKSERDLQPSHLLFAAAVVHHAVLGGHGLRSVQGGCVEGHLFDLGDAVGAVGHAQALCLVWVPPVLEELLEERRLAHLWQDLDLGVSGVVHLLDEVLSCLHRRPALVNVGVFAWKGEKRTRQTSRIGAGSITAN